MEESIKEPMYYLIYLVLFYFNVLWVLVIIIDLLLFYSTEINKT